MGGRRRALLIATDTYSDRLFRGLRGPGADVQALAALLADPSIGGYSVQVSHNQPAHDVALAINGLFVEARPGDLILLYMAGHGIKDDAGQLYLAMANSRHDRLEATTVSAQFVRDQMTRSRSEHIAVWLDCCYAGAFPAGAMHRTGSQFIDVLPRLGGRGRVVMTASSALEYAYETVAEPDLMATTHNHHTSGRGVFTDALIKGLGTGDADLDGDGLIDVDELYQYVYDQVEASPFQQTPRLDSQVDGKLCIASSIRGPRTTFGLPIEVAQALRSPLPKVRLAVLDDVVELANSGNATTLAQVRATLTDLATDKDTHVAAAAQKHLQRLNAPDLTIAEPDEPSVPRLPRIPQGPPHNYLATFMQPVSRPVRLVSRHRLSPILAALVLTVAVAVSILASDQPEETKRLAGPTAPTSPSSTAPRSTTSRPPSSGPRIPASTNLTFTVTVDPIPGYRIGDSGIGGSAQFINVREVTGDPQAASRLAAWVSVYQAGAFDPREAQTGEAVTIAGKTAVYHSGLTEPGTEDYPGGALHKPAIAVQYAPDSWYLVQTDDQPPKARDTVLTVANAVRFGINRPMRFPVRFDYLPPGLRPCGGSDGLDPARITPEPWSGEIDLCDDLFGRSDNAVTQTGEAINIHMTNASDIDRPPKSNRIGGRPAKIDGHVASVDCGEFILDIAISPNHASRYTPVELQKIIESLTIRSIKNKSTWFNGTDALPTTTS